MIRLAAVGCVTPLGESPELVTQAIQEGQRALAPRAHLLLLSDPRAATVEGPDLGPYLRRKKDLRLLPRAAVLALPAAGRAMRAFAGDVDDLPLFVAVGREPPDSDDAEAALAAMEDQGHLDRARLGAEGRALYPPLLPLRTLPNMILAHISIAHGIRGENGTFAGGMEAGQQALQAAVRYLKRYGGFALVGAASAGTDLASARDRLRLELPDPPGEAAIFALLSADGDGPALPPSDATWRRAFRAACGDCGAVEGLAELLRP